MKTKVLVLFVAMLAVTAPARASIIINAVESAGDVVFTGGGTADTSALTFDSSGFAFAGVNPSFPFLHMNDGNANILTGLLGPSTFGVGFGAGADSSSGDTFGINFQSSTLSLLVPQGYVSGSALSGTMTFIGTTLADLGLTPGTTHIWTWGSASVNNADSLSLNIGAATTPEPSTLALLGLGLLSVGYARKRKA